VVNLSIVLDTEPVNTPDAEFRIRSALRTLAEMVVEASRDSKGIPDVETPLVSDRSPSQVEHTAIIET
jgi:hypothetical protein